MIVTAVSRRAEHNVSKLNQDSIRLLAGIGVEDDVHGGMMVQHLSRVGRDPARPTSARSTSSTRSCTTRLGLRGFRVRPGEMGENVTTRGLELLALPTGTKLTLGARAVVEVTGLRDPCSQLEGIQEGLMKAVLDRDEQGRLVRKIGVMAIVLADGEIRPGDPISVELPPPPHVPLQPV